MTVQEKKLLGIFALLSVLMLFVNILPAAYQLYIDERKELAQMHHEMERYRKLLGTDANWQAKLDQLEGHRQVAEAGLFQGDNREIIDARMQNLVKKLAKQAGVRIDSIGLAEYTSTEEWLMVNKQIRFNAKTEELVKLLQLLQTSKPRLNVIGLDVRVNRLVLRGTVKVVGLSHLIDDKVLPNHAVVSTEIQGAETAPDERNTAVPASSNESTITEAPDKSLAPINTPRQIRKPRPANSPGRANSAERGKKPEYDNSAANTGGRQEITASIPPVQQTSRSVNKDNAALKPASAKPVSNPFASLGSVRTAAFSVPLSEAE